jgi:YggT family protein
VIGSLLCAVAWLYLVAIFGRIILSWFPIEPGSAIASVFGFLFTITEPLLGPLRRVLPPVGVGGMGLDLSPIIVILAIQLLVIPLLCG